MYVLFLIDPSYDTAIVPSARLQCHIYIYIYIYTCIYVYARTCVRARKFHILRCICLFRNFPGAPVSLRHPPQNAKTTTKAKINNELTHVFYFQLWFSYFGVAWRLNIFWRICWGNLQTHWSRLNWITPWGLKIGATHCKQIFNLQSSNHPKIIKHIE